MKSRKSVKKSRAEANARAAVEAEQMRSHDPAADQHHHYDGSAAANHQDLDLGDKDIANLAKTRANLTTALTPPAGWDFSPKGHLYSSRIDQIPADFPAIKIPELDFPRFEPDYDWSKGVPQFVTDLEAAIEAADITGVSEVASEIAAELLKHPALQGYLEVGEIANAFVPDCEYQNHIELDDPEQAHSEQFQRYAPHFDIAKSAGGSLDQHVGFDYASGEPSSSMNEIIKATAKAVGVDLTEQEFLGNDADGMARWERRRPQLMAQAKAGVAALQELAGMAAEHKGFHEDRPISGPELANWQGNKLMLIVSEVVEAHDEIRSGQKAWNTYYPTFEVSNEFQELTKGKWKPEGVPSEIADVVIRASDFAWTEGFDLADIIIEKLEFNATRGHKHGKAF